MPSYHYRYSFAVGTPGKERDGNIHGACNLHDPPSCSCSILSRPRLRSLAIAPGAPEPIAFTSSQAQRRDPLDCSLLESVAHSWECLHSKMMMILLFSRFVMTVQRLSSDEVCSIWTYQVQPSE